MASLLVLAPGQLLITWQPPQLPPRRPAPAPAAGAKLGPARRLPASLQGPSKMSGEAPALELKYGLPEHLAGAAQGKGVRAARSRRRRRLAPMKKNARRRRRSWFASPNPQIIALFCTAPGKKLETKASHEEGEKRWVVGRCADLTGDRPQSQGFQPRSPCGSGHMQYLPNAHPLPPLGTQVEAGGMGGRARRAPGRRYWRARHQLAQVRLSPWLQGALGRAATWLSVAACSFSLHSLAGPVCSAPRRGNVPEVRERQGGRGWGHWPCVVP